MSTPTFSFVTGAAIDHTRARLDVIRAHSFRDSTTEEHAQELFEQANAEFGPDAEITLECEKTAISLAANYQRVTDSRDQLADLRARCTTALGATSILTQNVVQLHATYTGLCDREAGIEASRAALAAEADTHGQHARRTRIARLNLAIALRDSLDPDRLDEAIRLTQTEWQERLIEYGPDNEFVWNANEAYLRACVTGHLMKRPYESLDQLERLSKEVLTKRISQLGDKHQRTITSKTTYAQILTLQGRHDKAIWMLLALQAETAMVPSRVQDRLPEVLARALAQTGDPDDHAQALKIAGKCLEQVEAKYGPSNPRTDQLQRLVNDLTAP